MNNSSMNTIQFTTFPMYLSNKAKFWLLLVFLVPSIFCSLFILYFLLFTRSLRHALSNHVIIIVVIIGLICKMTNYPWMLYYYQYQGTWERSLIFCEIWGYFDWGFYITHTILFAWATIERHILVFHNNWVSTKRRRFFVHYLPIICFLLYSLIFYLIVTFFPPCSNQTIDDTVCLDYCFYEFKMLYLWQTIVHQIMPNIIIVVVTIGLLVRVIWQKFCLHRVVQWRKHRKMIIQLLSISFLYLLLSFPLAIVHIILLFKPTIIIDPVLFDSVNYIGYFIMLLLPFVCILSFDELRHKISRLLYRRRKRAIHPVIQGIKTVQNAIIQKY